jgi:hypothetical protein
MKPMTIAFFITLGTGAYIIMTSPHLWFFAMLTTLYSGVAMVQADLISLLVNKIRHKDMLLMAAKSILELSNKAIEAQAKQHNEKESA